MGDLFLCVTCNALSFNRLSQFVSLTLERLMILDPEEGRGGHLGAPQSKIFCCNTLPSIYLENQ